VTAIATQISERVNCREEGWIAKYAMVYFNTILILFDFTEKSKKKKKIKTVYTNHKPKPYNYCDD
jgi:hypothetical protein